MRYDWRWWRPASTPWSTARPPRSTRRSRSWEEGDVNSQGGEESAKAAYKLLEVGYKTRLLNLAGTKIVNSIGISILIEIIEKMIEIDGKLGFCCLTPTIEKTFHIMGLAQYAPIYPDETTAAAQMRS